MPQTMKRISQIKPEHLVTMLHWLGWPAIAAYFVCMAVIPVLRSGFNWDSIQGIWERWQGLNVGMLALIASVIAFQISRYKENKQRERDFLAARAFLPASLSSLCSYLKDSAKILIHAWEDAATRRRAVRRAGAIGDADDGEDEPARVANAPMPQLPSSYEAVFADCIRHAEPEVGEYLAKMLSELQVHDSRMRELLREYQPVHHSLFSYLFSLGKLQTRVNKLFQFSRGEEAFDSNPIEWDEFHNAYKNLDIDVDDYDFDLGGGVTRTLTDFTQRAIARMKGQVPPPYPGENPGAANEA